MKKFEKIASVAMALLFPMIAMAATITDTLTSLKTILNSVIGLLFILVTLWFLWGVIQYVMAAGEEAKIKTGKDHMIWGIIGMAVMAGAWGLVNIVLSTFGVGGSNPIPTGPQGGF